MDGTLATITKAENLPVLPTVVVRVLEMADDDSSSLQQLGEVIQTDAAISAALIKMANSALYSARQPADSVAQALSRIGLAAAVPLVISCSLRGLQKSFDAPIDFEHYWRRSLLCASGGAFLSRFSNVKRETALLAGLVQDIGLLAAASAYPEHYSDLGTEVWNNHSLLCERESQRFGFDHAKPSAELLKNWGFPAELSHAAALSHSEPNLLERDLTWCVSGAGLIADAITQGFESGDLVGAIKNLLDAYWLPVAPEAYDDCVLSCLELISQTEQLFEEKLLPEDIEQLLEQHQNSLAEPC